MGTVEVPGDALYGAQTRRAELNFPISGWRLPRRMIWALGLIKGAAARANRDLGRLDTRRAAWIERAAGEVARGEHDEQFVVDVFQTGSGTSSNMNANEVVANRAIELAGGTPGRREPVHPNDHVNMGQSSNDVVPTALQVAVRAALDQDLVPALEHLRSALDERARAFDDVVKAGRTHLQDALPIRVGQVFRGYAARVEAASRRMRAAGEPLARLPIGGTAVGTGANTHPEFGARVAAILAEETGLPLAEATDHVAAQSSGDVAVQAAAALKTVALTLHGVADGLRRMGAGPRCGPGEILLPAVQPGSSMMPGKVNPVIAESAMQVAAYVVGAEASVAFAAATLSDFELCAAQPLVAHQLLESARLVANAARNLADRCVSGIEVDGERCADLAERSLALCTALAPHIGHDAAAALARRAHAEGRTVRQVALELGVLPEDELERLLDTLAMTGRR